MKPQRSRLKTKRPMRPYPGAHNSHCRIVLHPVGGTKPNSDNDPVIAQEPGPGVPAPVAASLASLGAPPH